MRAIDDLEIFERSRESGGFLGGRLLRPLGAGPLLVIAEWESARYYQGWLDNPVRASSGEGAEPHARRRRPGRRAVRGVLTRPNRTIRVATDVGGTFTDLVYFVDGRRERRAARS